MKQIDITNKNKDLDLRRFSKGVYSKAEKSGGSDGGGSADINTILDNISIKDDLLTKLKAIDYTNQGLGDGVLTDLTFDDVFNDYNDFIKSVLYKEETPDISDIIFQYSPQIKLTKQDIGYMKLAIPDEENPIYYFATIFDENNSIKIYASKQGSK